MAELYVMINESNNVVLLIGIAVLILIAVFVYVILFNVKHAKIHKREATLMFIQKKRYQLVMDNSEDMIYEIRGKQVMLDSDVAMLFGYETKYLNRQVQRNIERFPEVFSF